MSKKMTMAEISRQLGISTMTVSRYFNGGYVSKRTALKLMPSSKRVITRLIYLLAPFVANPILVIAPRI
jgi:DNA-binding LacI/PurR family transcriptional regulator